MAWLVSIGKFCLVANRHRYLVVHFKVNDHVIQFTHQTRFVFCFLFPQPIIDFAAFCCLPFLFILPILIECKLGKNIQSVNDNEFSKRIFNNCLFHLKFLIKRMFNVLKCSMHDYEYIKYSGASINHSLFID